jgi:hypothetical protein
MNRSKIREGYMAAEQLGESLAQLASLVRSGRFTPDAETIENFSICAREIAAGMLQLWRDPGSSSPPPART